MTPPQRTGSSALQAKRETRGCGALTPNGAAAGAEVWFEMKAMERELLSIDDLHAAAARLDLDAESLLSEPCSHLDRFGEYKAPFGVAVKAAKQCCERFS